MLLEDYRVTNSPFWINHLVYTDQATPSVSLGDQISLQGYFDRFQGTDELIQAEVLTSAVGGGYGPLDVLLAEAADGSPKADELASLLIRVLSVDDHPLLREGIAAVINNQRDMEIVAL